MKNPFLILVCLSVFVTTSFAVIHFEKAEQTLGDDEGRVSRLVDYDQDGDLDAVLLSGNMIEGRPGLLSLWNNRGDGTFDLGDSIGFGERSAQDIRVADLDNDGDEDLFVTFSRSGAKIFRNDGKGDFIEGKQEIGRGASHAVLEDLDGDGDTDVWMVGSVTPHSDPALKPVRIWLNDGTGVLTDSGQQLGGGVLANSAAGDIDGDGDIDVVTSGWFHNNDPRMPNPNKIWLNDGRGKFTEAEQILFEGQHHSHGIALADLDGDDDLDLILSFTSNGGSLLFFNDGKGRFLPGETITYGWFDEVIPADMDNDGDVDLVAANGGFERIPNSIWLNDGSGHFSDSGWRIGNDWTWDVAVGDVNGDETKDILYMNFVVDDELRARPNTLWLNTVWKAHWTQQTPGLEPEVFMPGIVSVDGKNTHALHFSPDGRTLVFSRYPDQTSYFMTWQDGIWSEPVETYFKGKEVCFSSDSARVFYYRAGNLYQAVYPNPESESLIETHLQLDGGEYAYYPNLVNSGKLYFSLGAQWNQARTMVAARDEGSFCSPAPVDETINSEGASHAFVAPDESYMLFNSPREGSYTENDIWISRRNSEGAWQAPKNLGNIINQSSKAVLCPTVSPDGKFLFFTRLESDGTGLLYWVSTNVFASLP